MSDRIDRLEAEVGRLSGIVQSLAPAPAVEPTGKRASAALRSIIRARQLRASYFPAGIFADPAWDMLLDLMRARQAGQAISISSLCIASGVPPTTALRWIKTMTDRGIFVRTADAADGRRVFIRVADDAAAAFTAWARAAGINLENPT